MTLAEQMTHLAQAARNAARSLVKLTPAEKDDCLMAMAETLVVNRAVIEQANARDMEAAAQMGLASAMLDRLRLDGRRIAAMAQGLRQVAALPDPVGRLLDERVRPNGLRLQKVATPIGVIVIIYESRPNVTADAAGLCFKSGNATILRGGREAAHSNSILVELMVAAAARRLPAFPEAAIQLVPTPDREAIQELLALTSYIDLCIPRGGEGLIRAVAECSKVPVIKHYKGVCHVYVDAAADLAMAEEIVLNAKCQRPAVCNAMETLLVDHPVAPLFLPRIAGRLGEKQVRLRVDAEAETILQRGVRNAEGERPVAIGPGPTAGVQSPGSEVQSPEAGMDRPPAVGRTSPLEIRRATDRDFFTEYNDYILNVRVVDGVRGAIDHVNHYGSAHSDAIVTRDEARARQFLAEVDSAAVYWNASTRFTDGGEFGMGAEIGISTDKIGARGPMGLEELTSYKWIGIGNGQVRA